MSKEQAASRPRKSPLAQACWDSGVSFLDIAREARALGSPVHESELSRVNTGARPLLPHHAETLSKIFAARGVVIAPSELIARQEDFARSLCAVSPDPLPPAVVEEVPHA